MDNSKMEMDDIRQYLQMLQDIINRMATNSSNCKVWTVSLFTAMTALIIGVDVLRPYLLIILMPILLFYFLDAYYLGLENDFRDLETSFLKRLQGPEDCSSSVYDFNFTHAEGYKKQKNLKKGLMSNATWPLYSTLTVIVLALFITFRNVPKANNQVQELEEPLRQLVVKQDSISCAINAFIKKYEPVSIDYNTCQNPSSFKANSVDSAKVKE